jgi:hypothetical protein
VAQVTIFGQLLTPAGVPAVGVGVAITAGKADPIAATVSARNGLFILRYPQGALPPDDPSPDGEAGSTTEATHARDAAATTGKASIRLSVNKNSIKARLPASPGLYGPLRLVGERAPTHRHATLAPRPVLGVDEKELATILTVAPELFLAPVSVEEADACSAYGAPNVANRTYYFNQLIPLVRPAAETTEYGVLVTYRQEWWDLGRSVGDLLYSVPLAPGEETKIATVDWRRVDQARRQTSLDEAVAQDTSITRIDSIDDSVRLRSEKDGKVTTTMDQSQSGGGASLSVDGFGLGAAASGSSATTVTEMHELTDATATNSERINDHVHQASNTLRGTRSMAIAEVAENETSTVSTRVVRNHNHSHTLTIEYFQVLSHYLVKATPASWVPVQFVPLDTTSIEAADGDIVEALLESYAPVILRALREPAYANEVRAFMVAEAPTRAAAPGTPTPPTPSSKSNGTFYFAAFTEDRKYVDDARSTGTVTLIRQPGASVKIKLDAPKPGVDPHWLIGTGQGDPLDYSQQNAIDVDPLPAERRAAMGDVLVPAGLQHVTVIAQDENGRTAHSLLEDASLTGETWIPPSQVKVVDWPLASSAASPQPASDATQPKAPRVSPGLRRHLEDNRLYYDAAVMASWHSSTLYEWLHARGQDQTLAPEIVGQLGALLAFPLNDRRNLPERFGVTDVNDVALGAGDERIVTLPTPGVFAESMLGACSASEVIDNTRFWDWISSPIPEEAPEITAAMLASRFQSQAEMTRVERSDLLPPAVQIPTEPRPFIEIGDGTMSELIKGLDFGGDAAKVVAFLQGAAQAAATAAGLVPKPSAASKDATGGAQPGLGGAGDSTAGEAPEGAASEAGAGDVAPAVSEEGALAATTEVEGVPLAAAAAA